MAATATGYLELNIKGFEEAINTAKKLLLGLGAAFGAVKLTQLFKEGISDAIKFGNEMYHAGQKIGQIDPGQLLLAQKALEDAGFGAQEARGQIDEMVTSMRPFSTLFKGGQQAWEGALKASAQNYGAQAKVLTQSASAMSKVFEQIQAVSSKIGAFFLSMTQKFVKPLAAVLTYLQSIDLAGVGERFGKTISDAAVTLVGVFKNGNLGLTIGLSLKVGFMNAVEWLGTAIESLFGDKGLGKSLGDTLGRYLFAFKEMFVAIADYMAGALVKAIAFAFRDLKIAGVQVVGHDTLNDINMAGNRLQDDSEGRFNNAKGAFGSGNDLGGFMSGLITGITTETSQARKDLAAALASGKKTGDAIVEAGAKAAGPKFQLMQQGLGHQEPYKVIADSLAKVGGGGGFIRQSMSIEAREAIKHTKALEAQIGLQKITNQLLGKMGAPVMKK